MTDSPRWSVPREGGYWLLASFALGFTGWYKNINLILLLAYLMAALWVLNAVVARLDLRNLRGRRILTGSTHAGTPTAWGIEVVGQRRGPSRTGWLVVDRGADHERSWFVTWWEGRPLRLRCEVTLPKRGRSALAPLTARSRYPFGLVEYEAPIGPADEVVVFPRLGLIDGEALRDWLAKVSRGDGRRHSMVRHVATQEADIHGLRPFRLGDSPRWIHWRTSARRGELVVREFENQPSPDLVLVVEALAAGGSLERLMSLAATICREWCREPNVRLALILASGKARAIVGRTGSDFAHDLMRELALDNGGARSDDAAVAERMPSGWRSMPVLVLTSDGGSELAGRLESRLGRPVPNVWADRPPGWYEADAAG